MVCSAHGGEAILSVFSANNCLRLHGTAPKKASIDKSICTHRRQNDNRPAEMQPTSWLTSMYRAINVRRIVNADQRLMEMSYNRTFPWQILNARALHSSLD